jgi:two-component system response regulator QseB
MPVLELGALKLNPMRREVTARWPAIELVAARIRSARSLHGTSGQGILAFAIWKSACMAGRTRSASNAVEVHLHNLRRKLGKDWIRNVRGVGYKIALP